MFRFKDLGTQKDLSVIKLYTRKYNTSQVFKIFKEKKL